MAYIYSKREMITEDLASLMEETRAQLHLKHAAESEGYSLEYTGELRMEYGIEMEVSGDVEGIARVLVRLSADSEFDGCGVGFSLRGSFLRNRNSRGRPRESHTL